MSAYRKSENVTAPVVTQIEDIIDLLKTSDKFLRPMLGEELVKVQTTCQAFGSTLSQAQSEKLLWAILQIIASELNKLLAGCPGKYRFVLKRPGFFTDMRVNFVDESGLFRRKLSSQEWYAESQFDIKAYTLDAKSWHYPGIPEVVVEVFKTFVMLSLRLAIVEVMVRHAASVTESHSV